jgi:16S rRNA (uracil1498-N3)-methyltransferase
MHLFYQPEPVLYLTEDDSRHAVKTLRLGIGDSIAITDGHGNRHSAVITLADSRRCTFRIIDTHVTAPRPFSVRICVAPTKNIDRIEWFIEKAVEIGIERISFFFGQHSERRVLKLDRLEKIAIAAMKQSLQSFLPQLDDAVSFSDLLKTVGGPTFQEEQLYIAHLPENAPAVQLAKAATTAGRYAVLIGPEGDFSEKEIQQSIAAGFQMVTLGPNRLRTETAALTACQLLNFINT